MVSRPSPTVLALTDSAPVKTGQKRQGGEGGAEGGKHRRTGGKNRREGGKGRGTNAEAARTDAEAAITKAAAMGTGGKNRRSGGQNQPTGNLRHRGVQMQPTAPKNQRLGASCCVSAGG